MDASEVTPDVESTSASIRKKWGYENNSLGKFPGFLRARSALGMEEIEGSRSLVDWMGLAEMMLSLKQKADFLGGVGCADLFSFGVGFTRHGG